ncbi:MORN repeat-containing protein 3 [Cichlidogyrus casuarinus]|uniref:MORN repeat-containing protein 3 n=1 Tax=Cichlidogyrus casuarinus TaxID=1844966 RepID=A0ABD2PN30_9PLAT
MDKNAKVSKQKVYTYSKNYYNGELLGTKKHGIGIFTDLNKQMQYEGMWENDKRSGKGVLLSIKNDDPRKIYEGEWKDGMRDGTGENWYSSTEYYEGEWAFNKRDGWGRMYSSDGSIYEGEWKQDKMSGKGLMYMKNGNRYEGQWSNGQKNGSGKMFFTTTQQLLEGYWVDDICKCGKMGHLPELKLKEEDYKPFSVEEARAERFPLPPLELKHGELLLKNTVEAYEEVKMSN